jgi:hypothetical protein
VASAELLKNFKYDGQLDVNAYSYNNADFNKDAQDATSNTDTRVMINAGFDLNDDVDAVVSVIKNERQYGEGSQTVNDANGNSNTGNGIMDSLFVEQAYVNLKGVFGLDHKLGRQYYGEQGDMVLYVGPGTWPYAAKFIPGLAAIDGWTGWYSNDNWKVNAIMGKLNNGGTTTPSTDVNLSGINASTKFMDIDLNGYYYEAADKNTAVKIDHTGLLGIRAKYAVPAVENLNVAAEYDMNTGSDFNKPAIGYEHKGSAYKLNADYSMDFMGKLGFEGEYVYQSGDETANKKDTAFTSINGDYRPGIIMGAGFMTKASYYTAGVLKGSGIVTYNLGANWNPEKMEKLTVAAKYYDFSADKKSTLTDKHYGSEFDLCANWMHSENVGVKAYYAMFMPEKDNTVTDDAQTMMGAAFNVKF